MPLSLNKKEQITLIVLLCLWFAADEQNFAFAADKPHPGQASFEEYCASCHGYDGVPIVPGTPNFANGERLTKKTVNYWQ